MLKSFFVYNFVPLVMLLIFFLGFVVGSLKSESIMN